MSHTLQTVLNTSLPLIGLAFIIWLFVRAFNRADNPMKLLLKWAFSIPFALFCFWMAKHMGYAGTPLIVIMGVILSIIWTPHISAFLFSPLTNIFDDGKEPPEPKPYYSIPRSLRMKGKFTEAIVEIRKQLARFPNDFEGVMMLAGIQAEDLNDLPGAELTLTHFCDKSATPPKQVAAAMNNLADWQLKLAQDSDSARAALEKITTRFPDTELALLAAQRIAHLCGAEKNLLAAHDRQLMTVPEGVKNAGLLESSGHLRPDEIDPVKLAADYVKHLELHPLDTEVREKLAIIYADHYQRLDLATGELYQLIEEPNQQTKRVAHWLNLLADLQIRHGADYDTVRGTLEQIVERFPDLAVAEMARTRLGRLKLELKGQTETPAVKLGVYEQNLGLKHTTPRQL